MVHAPASRSFAFGPFTFFPERQLLLRDEKRVRIGGRAIELLLALVERPGQLVTKSELLTRVWPDTTVAENNLKVNIASLRRVLEEAPGPPQYVATVVGRGYRFVAPVRVTEAVEADAASEPNHHLLVSPAGADAPLIGRVEELAVLRQAVESALGGGTGLVVVEGEPGVGKTHLLEEAAAEGTRRGALVVWGRCLEGDGTPSMWPWVQSLSAVLDSQPLAEREEWYAGELGRLVRLHGSAPVNPLLPGAQFRQFEQTVALVSRVSERRPIVLVVDDLQWADASSLDLFSHLAARLPSGAVLIGALRDRAPVPGSELSRMLAVVSRSPRHRRLRLGPLGPTEVAELVRRETGQDPAAGVVRSVHARTAGNPFFVRELSRLLAHGGSLVEHTAAEIGVPSTVRDVVRDRVSGLDDNTISLLQIGAVIGRDVDLRLLARTAGLEVRTCLGLLEPLEQLGLLEPAREAPGSFRFVHDLVRESIVDNTPGPLAAQLHLRVADELERMAVDDALAERLAHHLWSAGALASPTRTAATLIRAGRCAAGKSALAAAARQLQSAAQVARTAGLSELELSALTLLTAVDGMREGYHPSALEVLERAERLARDLGREREAADFLFSRWLANAQGMQLGRAHPLARRLLERGEASTDPIIQMYGRYAWAIHQWGIGNVGEAFRYLSRTSSTVLDDLARGDDEQLRRDLRLLGPVMHALMTALHGDVATAEALLKTIEAAAGNDPYVITVWAAFAVTIAALANDPKLALRAAERGIAVDPEFSFGYFGAYQRLARCWARAVTGDAPTEAAAEAHGIIARALTDPPRSGLATWYGLLAEMWLCAGRLDESAAALDRADSCLETYGERYAEGLLLALRARLLQARGEPSAAVRAAAERARTLSVAREAHLFAGRAEEVLAGLAEA